MYHACWQFLDFVRSERSHRRCRDTCEGVYLTALPFMSAGKLVQAYVTTYVPRHSLSIMAFLPERIELPHDYRVRIIFHAWIRLISGLNDKATSSRSQTSRLKNRRRSGKGKWRRRRGMEWKDQSPDLWRSGKEKRKFVIDAIAITTVKSNLYSNRTEK